MAMNSLHSEKGQWTVPMVREKKRSRVCCEDNYFPKEKFKFFNSLFHWVYFVFSILLFSIANLFAVRYLWDVRNEDKCCAVTHRLVDIRVAWLVYLASLSSHVLLPIATLNQNKPSRLLYLGDAQITNSTTWKYCWRGFIQMVTP